VFHFPHLDAVGGGLGGALIALGTATQLPAPPSGPLDLAHLVGYAISLLVAFGPILLKRAMSARAAGDLARVAQLRARAAKLPEGSPERRALEDQADELEADAARVEAAGKG
jgi:hypothetical protein